MKYLVLVTQWHNHFPSRQIRYLFRSLKKFAKVNLDVLLHSPYPSNLIPSDYHCISFPAEFLKLKALFSEESMAPRTDFSKGRYGVF